MADIIQMSYIILVADLAFLLFVMFNSIFTVFQKSMFIIAGFISFLMVVCNIVTYLHEDFGYFHHGTARFFTALSYSISGPVMLPFISLSSVINRKHRNILYLFAAINAVISFMSISTGWAFYYDGTHHLHFGVLAPLSYSLSALYTMVLLIASIRKFQLGFRHECVFLIFLCCGILTGVIMNNTFGFRFLISGMAVLSCIFYYLFFTTQTLTRDALTNALNRHSFYKDVERMKKQSMFLIALDLNGLKQINDLLGHDEGDKAILAVSKSVFSVIPNKCKFYRMGGDEFEILCPNMSETEIQGIVIKLKQEVCLKGYSTAIGYGAYRKGMDFDAVFKDVDAMMYEDKARMKALARKEKGE